MPAGSRAQQRAEAKYNVTTDCAFLYAYRFRACAQFEIVFHQQTVPRYDLHFAAASGDLGLVEFALSHGQPVNSVLNGVLPLHAACAGGSEVVVKYLIEEGADVNAPRCVNCQLCYLTLFISSLLPEYHADIRTTSTGRRLSP